MINFENNEYNIIVLLNDFHSLKKGTTFCFSFVYLLLFIVNSYANNVS